MYLFVIFFLLTYYFSAHYNCRIMKYHFSSKYLKTWRLEDLKEVLTVTCLTCHSIACLAVARVRARSVSARLYGRARAGSVALVHIWKHNVRNTCPDILLVRMVSSSLLLATCLWLEYYRAWFSELPSLELVSPLQVTHLPPVWGILLPLA